MKKVRVILPALAVVFAIGGAIASNLVEVTQGGTLNKVLPCNIAIRSVDTQIGCDVAYTGPACLLVSTGNPPAYQTDGTECAIAIKRKP
jgi:hypothetical protein